MKSIYSPLPWYPIPGYESYQINELGTVRSFRALKTRNGTRRFRKKYLKSRINQDYIEYRLSKNGVQKVVSQHRLLAIVFIANPESRAEVNHINGIKNDNRLDNLEWVTHKGNMVHAHKHGLFKTLDKYCKKVKDNCTGEVFASVKKAAQHRGYRYSSLKNYLNGHRKNPTCLQYYSHL